MATVQIFAKKGLKFPRIDPSEDHLIEGQAVSDLEAKEQLAENALESASSWSLRSWLEIHPRFDSYLEEEIA